MIVSIYQLKVNINSVHHISEQPLPCNNYKLNMRSIEDYRKKKFD